jgi:hypothetical protein
MLVYLFLRRVFFISRLTALASKYAAVMGISADLKLTGNEFSNVGSSFFIAYLIAEVPNSELHLLVFLVK